MNRDPEVVINKGGFTETPPPIKFNKVAHDSVHGLVPRYIFYTFVSDLTDTSDRTILTAPESFAIIEIRISKMLTPPPDDDLIIDLEVDTASIFDSDNQRPTMLEDATTEGAWARPIRPNVNAGSDLSFHVIQDGGAAAPFTVVLKISDGMIF